MGRNDYEVIVVGAGFAGVAAAQELGRLGRTALLLEARARIGGRTWTDSFAGKPVEMGGAWVHWFQPHVWSAVSRHGIEIVEDEPPTRGLLASGDGLSWFDIDLALERLENLNRRFYDGSEEYFSRPHDPLFNRDAVAAIDALSLRDRFEQMDLTADEKGWLSGMYSALAGGPSTNGGFSMAARWWSLSGWNFGLLWDCLSRYRLRGGTSALIRAMLADSTAEVQLESPVASVEQTSDGVQVATRSGHRASADGVIVAVPANVWPTIDFTPSLSAPRMAAASEGVGVAHGLKVWVRVRGKGIGRVFGAPPEGYRFTLLVTYAELGDDEQLLVCFSPDPTLDPSDLDQVEAGIKQLIPQAEVLGAHCHDWGTDEFSQGAGAYFKPGHLTRYLPALQASEGRIAFATGDIASGWAGFIDGAVESGLRAAEDIDRTIQDHLAQRS